MVNFHGADLLSSMSKEQDSDLLACWGLWKTACTGSCGGRQLHVDKLHAEHIRQRRTYFLYGPVGAADIVPLVYRFPLLPAHRCRIQRIHPTPQNVSNAFKITRVPSSELFNFHRPLYA